jgi:hypothetical protein
MAAVPGTTLTVQNFFAIFNHFEIIIGSFREKKHDTNSITAFTVINCFSRSRSFYPNIVQKKQ